MEMERAAVDGLELEYELRGSGEPVVLRRFLADASHELRTPLTSLAGNVEFLVRHGADVEVLNDLELDSRRLQRLVDDLLALEREDGAPAPGRPVRLDRIVAEAVAARPRARAQADAAVTVLGEPEALRRALDNLLENAEVHGPAGGEILVALTHADGRAALAVSDEGPGLDPAEAERAFDRFWRGSDAVGRPGAGLGLALVRATARRHGGEVTAAGSTVTITLPAGGPSGVGAASKLRSCPNMDDLTAVIPRAYVRAVRHAPIDPDAFNAFEAAGWEERAPGYDRFFGSITSQLVEPLLDAASVGARTRVLDIATGPGDVASQAAERGASVIGVDVAEAMVALARRLHPELDFRQADAHALPFEDASFDAVLGNFVILHLGRPEQAAAEVVRVLARGGKLALRAWDLPERARLLGVFLDAVAEAGATPPHDVPVGPDFFRFSVDQEFDALLREQGLEDRQVKTIAFTHRVSTADELWDGCSAGRCGPQR